MQTENEKGVPLIKSEIKGCEASDSANTNVIISGSDSDHHGKGKNSQVDDQSESFYKKLSELYESSGLNLVFNVRETLLDLHRFYKEVTERGGFHEVSKYRKWDDVAFALKSDGINLKLPCQLQNLYAVFLYQFEQMHYYRAPAKAATDPGHRPFCTMDSSSLKRKSGDELCGLTDIEDAAVRKKKRKDNATGPRTAEQRVSRQTPSKNKEMKKRPGTPRGLRTAYHIFIKKECARLRTFHGENLDGQKVRDRAIVAWKRLPQSERLPYIEESRKEKERFCQEFDAYKECLNTQNTKTTKNPRQEDGDNHVILQPDTENSLVPDQSTADFGSLDENLGSFDVPTEGSDKL